MEHSIIVRLDFYKAHCIIGKSGENHSQGGVFMDVQNNIMKTSGGMLDAINKQEKKEKSVLGTKNILEDRLKEDTGVKAQTSAIYKTFGVDKVVKGVQYRNLVKESGNLLQAGMLHNAVLGKTTGKTDIKGSKFVENNNMLETWKDANRKTRRAAVMDYSKTPEEQNKEKMKAIRELDVEA